MEKMNIMELLKDCPRGMELDSTEYSGVVKFDGLNKNHPYHIRISVMYEGEVNIHHLTKYGQTCISPYNKCVIFPKGKTTWDGFVPPCKFNAGDVLVSEFGNIVLLSHIDSEDIVHYHCIIPARGSFRIEENTSIGVGKYYDCVLANEEQRQRMYGKIKCSGYEYNQSINKLEKINPNFKDGDILFVKSAYSWICIYKESETEEVLYKYVATVDEPNTNYIVYDDCPLCHKEDVSEIRFATEEEKQKLFEAIKDSGYKWNAETKTLEKSIEPKFKVGDRIRHNENTGWTCTIVRIEDRYYVDGHPTCYTLLFDQQNEYELVSNKFDINTLKPFESRVLVRDYDSQYWRCSFFGNFDKGIRVYDTVRGLYKQCIPYEGNEHLLGKPDNCDKFYKTWE